MLLRLYWGLCVGEEVSRECHSLSAQPTDHRNGTWPLDVATRQVLMSMKDVSSIAADVSVRDVSNAVEVLRVMDAVRLAQVLLCVTPTQHGADLLAALAEPLRGRVVAAMGPSAACKLVAEMELKVALDVMLSLPVRLLRFPTRTSSGRYRVEDGRTFCVSMSLESLVRRR